MPGTGGVGSAVRRQVWIIVACAAAGAALFGTASAMRPSQYESRVEVQVDPVSLDARFGAPDAPATPEQAIGRELHLVRSDDVLGRADAQIEFDHSLRAEQVSGDTIRFVARSISPGFAQSVAQTAADTYVTVRQEMASGLADSAVQANQSQVDALIARQQAGEDVSADLAAAQARLADFQAGQQEVADTAHISLPPTASGRRVSPEPVQAALFGLVGGLVLGLVIAAGREWLRARAGDRADTSLTGSWRAFSWCDATGRPPRSDGPIGAVRRSLRLLASCWPGPGCTQHLA